MYLKLFGSIWRYSGVFGCIWRYLDVFVVLEIFGGIWRYWIFGDHLEKIYNNSINESLFPTQWKLARVTPIF